MKKFFSEKIIGIIPARYNSSRFPGKPLADILGKPMIQHVYENLKSVSAFRRIIVATDNEDIANTVAGFGGEVFMTSPEHKTGTDRVREVALKIQDADIIINVQGDEPVLKPETIEQLILSLIKQPDISIGTVVTKIKSLEELYSQNTVKVVFSSRNLALYFSRSPIPFPRKTAHMDQWYKHIGIYGFRRDFLIHFNELPSSRLESIEKLEQLRILENGYPILIIESYTDSQGVDIEEDIKKIEAILEAREFENSSRILYDNKKVIN